jgi:multiple sugar transport system permease protein
MAATPAPAVRRRGIPRSVLTENLWAYLFILPWILGFVLIEVGPVLASFALSFTNFDIVTPIAETDIVGLKNYDKMLFRDPLFWHSLKVTAIFSVGSVILGIIFGVILALMLNQNLRGIAFYRTIFFTPAVVAGVAVAYMWQWVLHKEAGIVNTLLRYIGIEGPNWLFNYELALPTFIFMNLWALGGGTVIYLAALQGVPTQLYEAAEIDGAGWTTKTWNVTIPMISPAIFFNLIMGIIGSFQVFINSFVITDGGPANATLFFVLYLYEQAFRSLRMGYASTLSVALFIVIMALTVLAFSMSGRWVYYEGELKR